MGSRRGPGEPPAFAIATSDWSAAGGGGDSCRRRRLTSRRLCDLFEAEVSSGSGAAPVLNNKKVLECKLGLDPYGTLTRTWPFGHMRPTILLRHNFLAFAPRSLSSDGAL